MLFQVTFLAAAPMTLAVNSFVDILLFGYVPLALQSIAYELREYCAWKSDWKISGASRFEPGAGGWEV